MSKTLKRQRRHELAKYQRAYEAANYKMKSERRQDAVNDIAALPIRGALLDVGCGRGEMLAEAEDLGFSPVQGTETVPALIDGQRVVAARVDALPFPDKAFDVTTMFDVIEHLIPGDDERACRELARVAKHHIVLTANNKRSRNKAGDELHINRRPYDEWDRLFRKWFEGHAVTWIKGERHYISEAWRIDLA
ncbi:Methyltransferase domain-containing protein [Filomicrobium insigne]|uniref:Methyltransferase domain-containing protein n=1 Tax=Filomicrobium insigne TaxID=418854 RepID=A0A1H0SH09_9HYPH|nr:class I SAM-dependent methyltransferase [Filomicrobium insigne]SDP40456.1 Methyltransferase domain-containing protein [Filomicrobium insigne]